MSTCNKQQTLLSLPTITTTKKLNESVNCLCHLCYYNNKSFILLFIIGKKW